LLAAAAEVALLLAAAELVDTVLEADLNFLHHLP
jgi:hypothetical protein